MNSTSFDGVGIDYDKKVKVHIFSSMENKRSSDRSIPDCSHLGYLVKDGLNISSTGISQRYKCTQCGKRFGNSTNEWDIHVYQEKIKQILYSLFFEGTKQTAIAERWRIPQHKLSQFKHDFVDAVFEQHPYLINHQEYALSKGVIYGDETFFGKRGNSISEIVFVNEDFEIIAAGLVEPMKLEQSIKQVFFTIPQKCRNKLRVLVSDGEPSYKSIPLLNSLRTLVVQQYHAPRKLGQISIHKYRKFGPHTLHYIINTHWKIFTKGKHEVEIKWAIKLILSKNPVGRGRPTKQMENSLLCQQRRQKKEEYYAESFQKHGTAILLINPDTRKVSLREGSKTWMKAMITSLFPIFSEKCITNNRVESKHAQIKRTGKLRKQLDREYANKLFQLQEYIVKTGHLPIMYLKGRPLYRYLLQNTKKTSEYYQFYENGKKMIQTTIPGFF